MMVHPRSLRLSGTTVTALALFLVATVASVDAQGTADAPVIAQSQTALPPSALAGFSVVSASAPSACSNLQLPENSSLHEQSVYTAPLLQSRNHFQCFVQTGNTSLAAIVYPVKPAPGLIGMDPSQIPAWQQAFLKQKADAEEKAKQTVDASFDQAYMTISALPGDNNVKEAAANAFGSGMNAVQGVFSTALNGIQGAANAVVGEITKVYDTLRDAASSVINAGESVISSIGGFFG
ncbi:hypothetical protein WJX73_006981 [Symbiochloris irregularis]|uniref:Uncharacterized protein n=1 Tax=Symbiochloris irregularis TaxID=706552 RepID=A0AAW1NPB1_9CHLO